MVSLPFRELDGPNEEEVFRLAIPWHELDARHELDRLDGLVDGDVAVRVCRAWMERDGNGAKR